jgi:hypothetical protein
MAMLSFGGIDVSKDRLDVVVLPEEECSSVPNDAAGWAELVERLRGFSITGGGYERGAMRALLAALLGGHEQFVWHGQPQRFCGLGVHHHLKLDRLACYSISFHGQPIGTLKPIISCGVFVTFRGYRLPF